jgi:hypothetical protein
MHAWMCVCEKGGFWTVRTEGGKRVIAMSCSKKVK